MIAGTFVCKAALVSPFGIFLRRLSVYDMQDEYMSAKRACAYGVMRVSVGWLANVQFGVPARCCSTGYESLLVQGLKDVTTAMSIS